MKKYAEQTVRIQATSSKSMKDALRQGRHLVREQLTELREQWPQSADQTVNAKTGFVQDYTITMHVTFVLEDCAPSDAQVKPDAAPAQMHARSVGE